VPSATARSAWQVSLSESYSQITGVITEQQLAFMVILSLKDFLGME